VEAYISATKAINKKKQPIEGEGGIYLPVLGDLKGGV